MVNRHACAVLMSLLLLVPAVLRAQQASPPETTDEAWSAFVREAQEALRQLDARFVNEGSAASAQGVQETPAVFRLPLLAELLPPQQPPQPAPQPARQPGSTTIPPRPAELQAFSVVLLEGDVQGAGSMPDDIPPAVRSAVADMKDFLPFKSYRLLDFGLTRAVPGHHASILLRVGPDAIPPAAVMLEVQQPPSASKLQVAFKLTGTTHTIETTLTMEVGETVIVGTSRGRQADKGLIALLTALPVRK